MAAITFAEIMNCYPENPLVYKHIKQDHGKLIPFVGAGLSVPCYPLWPKALKELAEQVAVPETKSDILDMVEGGNPQLLEAAQALEDYWGQRGMADHLLELFSAAKIQEYKKELSYQSVWLLPMLFPGKPAVTTNFDRVLETVYYMQGCPFDTKIFPNSQELQDQLRQGERHGLLKLHGDIGSETLEYSSIIFGKRQYQGAYQPGTPMVTNLQAWFSGKMLLFLGCSLKEDEYLNLLQGVVQLHPGVTHYAILECEDVGDAAARAKKLRDQWGIRALFYPKERHEAVRVILEKLLEDHNPTAYQALPTHVGALPDQSPSSRFHYKSGAVSFHGRREELEQLREFCGQEDVAFRWWAVTGAGGAGKSRLVYEFGREMKGSGWNVLWLNSSHMDQLESLSILTKTLVVVDYAQAYLGPLGRWIEKLDQRDHLVPVRLLLLERDGESLDESSWGIGLKSHVYRAKSIRESCWKEAFLQIIPLHDEELLRIMTDFSATVGKNLPEAKAQQLLETLKNTDPELRRPLYAMFLTDAWANEEKPEKWGQKAVLDYVLKREDEYFEEKLGPKLYDLSDVFCQLRLVATIWDGITPEQVAQEYPRLWSEFQDQSNTSNCAKMENKLLRQVGLLQGKELVGLKPDLLGEYFVLQHINKPEVLQLLFPDGWQSKLEIVAFLFHMYLDYHDELDNIEEFWKDVYSCTIYKHGLLSKKDYLAILYAGGLFLKAVADLITWNGSESDLRVLDELEKIHMTYPNNVQIARRYSQALVKILQEQSHKKAEEMIRKLEGLYRKMQYDAEIVLNYAQGLLHFSYKQSVEGAVETVHKIGDLHRLFPDDIEIAHVYGGGLFNILCLQAEKEAIDSICELEKLTKLFRGDTVIIRTYVSGLAMFACRESVPNKEKIISDLRCVCRDYPDNKEITAITLQTIESLSIE